MPTHQDYEMVDGTYMPLTQTTSKKEDVYIICWYVSSMQFCIIGCFTGDITVVQQPSVSKNEAVSDSTV